MDPDKPLSDRVDALLASMNPQQQIEQLSSDAPATHDKTIPAFNWWSGELTFNIGYTCIGLIVRQKRTAGLGKRYSSLCIQI
jgi:hypothetical protein